MRSLLRSLGLFPLLGLLLGASGAHAAVELTLTGGGKLVVQEIYQRDGAAFIAIEDLLVPLGLKGDWDNVDHVYRIQTKQGEAVISPGSDFLRFAGKMLRVAHRPRFINGKLRVSETFLTEQLIPLLALPVQVNNLNPVAPPPAESPLDQLFSLFLQQRPRAVADSQWVVAIDPGHGGQDAGALGPDGTTEQAVNLGVARQLHNLLKMRRDAPVVLTRDADYAVSSAQRLEAVSAGKADVLLALHTQAFVSPVPQGVTLFVAPPRRAEPLPGAAEVASPPVAAVNASLRLAEALRATLGAAGYQVAPIQERPLLPLGQGDLPRVMVEMGFLSNETDLVRLRDPAGQQQMARALFEGLEVFLKGYQDLQEASNESR
jgi:N-acetylmuramoyl-L-alanine amidase